MNIPFLIFGIILIVIGYRYYGYCIKNFAPNNQRSKNLAKAVLLLIMGFISLIMVTVNFLTIS